jgi:hypothetical protein
MSRAIASTLFINTRKRIGPSTKPCNLPDSTDSYPELVPLNTTLRFFPAIHARIHVSTLPLTPCPANCAIYLF